MWASSVQLFLLSNGLNVDLCEGMHRTFPTASGFDRLMCWLKWSSHSVRAVNIHFIILQSQCLMDYKRQPLPRFYQTVIVWRISRPWLWTFLPDWSGKKKKKTPKPQAIFMSKCLVPSLDAGVCPEALSWWRHNTSTELCHDEVVLLAAVLWR